MCRGPVFSAIVIALVINTVQGSANCVTDMGTGPYLSSGKSHSHIETLLSKSVAFSDVSHVPGGPAGLSIAGIRHGRYLKTKDIHESDLPYANAIRPVDRAALENPMVPRLNGRVRAFDVLLVSEISSGVSGIVRLGLLDGHRPVALKYYAYEEGVALNNTTILREAEDDKTLSGLGLLSQFHGVYIDENGRENLVTDIVSGDFSGTPVTSQTFADLGEMEKRLMDAREVPDDLQVYRTGTSRLLMIDGNVAKETEQNSGKRAKEFDSAYTRTLIDADPTVGQAELEVLRADPRRYNAVLDKLREMFGFGSPVPPYLLRQIRP